MQNMYFHWLALKHSQALSFVSTKWTMRSFIFFQNLDSCLFSVCQICRDVTKSFSSSSTCRTFHYDFLHSKLTFCHYYFKPPQHFELPKATIHDCYRVFLVFLIWYDVNIFTNRMMSIPFWPWLLSRSLTHKHRSWRNLKFVQAPFYGRVSSPYKGMKHTFSTQDIK